jgi:hypothetical protein
MSKNLFKKKTYNTTYSSRVYLRITSTCSLVVEDNFHLLDHEVLRGIAELWCRSVYGCVLSDVKYRIRNKRVFITWLSFFVFL